MYYMCVSICLHLAVAMYINNFIIDNIYPYLGLRTEHFQSSIGEVSMLN